MVGQCFVELNQGERRARLLEHKHYLKEGMMVAVPHSGKAELVMNWMPEEHSGSPR